MIGQMTNNFAVLAIHMKYFTEKIVEQKTEKKNWRQVSAFSSFIDIQECMNYSQT